MKVLEPGQKLRDTQYGPGVVLNSDPEYTTIRFRNFGTKKYVTSLLQMELVEVPKPAKPQAASAAGRSALKPIARSRTTARARHAKSSRKSRIQATRPARSRPRPQAKRKSARASHSASRKRSRR